MRTLCIALFFILAGLVGFAQADKNCCTSNPYPKTIKVTGSASMEVTPDLIFVNVNLREYKKKGEDKTELDKIKADFLALCKSQNIADSNIVVSNYGGSNSNIYQKKKKQNPDLFSTIRYIVKFKEMGKVNNFADGLDDEAVQDFDIDIDHSKMIEFRKELKIMAVRAAKDKAIYLTEAINEKLGEAITINEPDDPAFRRSSNSNSVYSNTLNVNISRDNFETGDPISDQLDNINFKKIKLRFEVEILFALK